MLRLFDINGRDITDDRQYCRNPACLGEPWCSAWGICQLAEEPDETASSGGGMEVQGSGSGDTEEEIDHIMLELSQQLQSSPTFELLDSSPTQEQLPAEQDIPVSAASRFATPVTDEEVTEARKMAVPKRTAQDTQYCIRQFESWRDHRNLHGSIVPSLHDLDPCTLSHWLTRFVLEIRKVNGSEYPPNSLHHLVCGIMRHYRTSSKTEIDFFKDHGFRSSLDAEMKRLQSKGIGSVRKQAEPFTMQEEELLWGGEGESWVITVQRH